MFKWKKEITSKTKLQKDTDMQNETGNENDTAVNSAIGNGQQNQNFVDETKYAMSEMVQNVILRPTTEKEVQTESELLEAFQNNCKIVDSSAKSFLEVQRTNDELELETEIKRKAAEKRTELEAEKGILLRGKMAKVREAQKKFYIRDHRKNRENDCGLSGRANWTRTLSTLSLSSTSSKESERGKCDTPTKSLFEEDMDNYQLKERHPQSQIAVTNGEILEAHEILSTVDILGRNKIFKHRYTSSDAIKLSHPTAAQEAFLFHFKKELSAIFTSPHEDRYFLNRGQSDNYAQQTSSHLSTKYNGFYNRGFIDHQNAGAGSSSRNAYDNQQDHQLTLLKRQRRSSYSVRFAKGTKYTNSPRSKIIGGRKVSREREDPDGIVVLETFEDGDDIPPRNAESGGSGAGEQKRTVKVPEQKMKERAWEKFLFYALCGVCIICTNKY